MVSTRAINLHRALRWIYLIQWQIRRWWYRSPLCYHWKLLRIPRRHWSLRPRLLIRHNLPKVGRNRSRLQLLHSHHQPMWFNLLILWLLIKMLLSNQLNNHNCQLAINNLCHHHWYLRCIIQQPILFNHQCITIILNCWCYLRRSWRYQLSSSCLCQWYQHIHCLWWQFQH